MTCRLLVHLVLLSHSSVSAFTYRDGAYPMEGHDGQSRSPEEAPPVKKKRGVGVRCSSTVYGCISPSISNSSGATIWKPDEGNCPCKKDQGGNCTKIF